MSDGLPRGELFGCPVIIDDDLPPGIIEIHPASGVPRGTAIPERPMTWGLMDNAARLMWLHQRAHVLIVVGEGTTEEMMSDQGMLA